MSERYTPGHSGRAVAFMTRRRLDPNGECIRPYLKSGTRVLDCGCGPGTITCDIARLVLPSVVTGIDSNESQIALAREHALSQAIENVEFARADVYALPYPDAHFDIVFSHALFEHLSNPQQAVDECYRVLRPGGTLGVCTPDWGGFIVAPPSVEVQAALEAYRLLQQQNGGDPFVGRKLGDFFERAGFTGIEQRARYENYQPLSIIADFLALNLEESGDSVNAAVWRAFPHCERGMFAQAWVSCIGVKPTG